MPRKKTTENTTDHRVTLDITDEIINGAVPARSNACVIAEAIKTQVPNASLVSVDLATIRWSDKTAGKRYVYLTPPGAQLLLYGFDRGLHPRPQTLTLRRPAQIANIKAASRSQREGRQERLATLEAKAEAGGTLTRGEKKSLTQLRQVVDRPTSEGPAIVDKEGTVHGGKLLPTGAVASDRARGSRAAIPENLPSHARTFGARKANPSRLDDMVDEAIARGRAEGRAETENGEGT